MAKVSRRLIDVSGMTDIIQRRIPVLTLDSKKDGPTIWLAACIHGDEPAALHLERHRTLRSLARGRGRSRSEGRAGAR